MSTCEHTWCDLDHNGTDFGASCHIQDRSVEVGEFSTTYNLSLDEDGPYLYWDMGGYLTARPDEVALVDDMIAALTKMRDDWYRFRDEHETLASLVRRAKASGVAPSTLLRRDPTATLELAERDV